MERLIEIKDLYYSYEQKTEQWALHNINLQIAEGEFLCILGANGSGKSTLAKHANAILKPTKGTVTVDGMDTSLDDKLWKIREKVGMVFQNPDNQIVASVVEEDVAFGLENLGLPSVEIEKRVDWALNLVGMENYRDRGPHFLSGGQKQRVCIASVMAMKPACLVLDEPTAMLDPKGRQEVLEIISELNRKEKITVILITHHMEEALLAHRVVVMKQGKVVAEGKPTQVFAQTHIIEAAGLELPLIMELSNALRTKGLQINKETMTYLELADELCR